MRTSYSQKHNDTFANWQPSLLYSLHRASRSSRPWWWCLCVCHHYHYHHCQHHHQHHPYCQLLVVMSLSSSTSPTLLSTLSPAAPVWRPLYHQSQQVRPNPELEKFRQANIKIISPKILCSFLNYFFSPCLEWLQGQFQVQQWCQAGEPPVISLLSLPNQLKHFQHYLQ